MVTQSKSSVVVYGATSYTARQALEYLDNHPDKSQFDLILAGRSRERVEKIARSLSGGPEVVACDLGDEKAVESLVERADVIMNFAGPYRWHNAEVLIRQCALQGKHYLDLSAEAHWLSSVVIPQYDYLASKTGACIVPSCGFDSVPSDLTLYHALRHLQSTHGPQVGFSKSTSFFRVPGASMSGGTIQTMYSEAEITDRKDDEYCMVDETGPSAPIQFLYTLTSPALRRQLIGSFFFMWPYNRCIIRRSAFLSRLDQSHLFSAKISNGEEQGEREPVHGKGMVYVEALQTKSRLQAVVISGVCFAFAGLFLGSSIASLSDWKKCVKTDVFSQIRRIFSYILPKAGDGPSREVLEKSSVNITNVSVSNSEPTVEVITTFRGEGDPGYLNTAYIMAESALALVLPPPKGFSLPPQGQVGGVLTASTAMGMVLVERLRISGKAKIHSETVDKSNLGKIKDI